MRARTLVHALLETAEVGQRGFDVVGEIAHEPEACEHAENQAERIAERGARLSLVAERDDREIRRAPELGDLPARREDEHLGAPLACVLERRERLLGVA